MNARLRLEQEFLELWHGSASKLQALCLSWTGRPDLAEEALARSRALALEKYPQHAHRLRHPDAWMRRLTYNVCIDLHRELGRRREDSLDEMEESFGSLPFPAGGDDPETAYLCRERRRMLRRAIDHLPDRLRRPLELNVFQGLDYREIADALCITEANVRKRMQHGREALEECFGAYHRRHQPIPVREDRRPRKRTDRDEGPERSVRAVEVVAVDGPEGRRGEVVQVWRRKVSRPTERRRASLESYIADHPGGWKRRLDLARLELRQGRLAAALEQYRVVVDKQPRRGDLWREMAAILAALGAREAAVEAYAEARRRSQTGAERQRLRAAMLELGGDTAGALEALRESLDAQPEVATLAAASARLELATGNPGRALVILESLRSRHPEDPEYLLWLHDALEAQGRSEEAHRTLERALELHGDHPPALVRWLAREPEPGAPEARERWRRRRERLEELAPEWLEVAWLAAHRGEEDGEIRFEDWLRRHPGHPQGRLRRLHLSLEAGHWREAAVAVAQLGPPSAWEVTPQPRLTTLPLLALDAAGDDRAADQAVRLSSRGKERAEVLAVAAVVLARRGSRREDLERAGAVAEASRAADPDGVRPRLAAAYVALFRDRPDDVLEVLSPLEALPFGGSPEAVAGQALATVARIRGASPSAGLQRDRAAAEAAWPEALARLARSHPSAARRWGDGGPGAVLRLPAAAWLLPSPWGHTWIEI